MKVKNEEQIEKSLRNFLLDDFSVCGDDAALFGMIQKRISDNTFHFVAPLEKVNILSVIPTEDEQTEEIAVYILNSKGVEESFLRMSQLRSVIKKETDEEKKGIAMNALLNELSPFRIMKIPEHSLNRELAEELRKTGLLFQETESKKTYIVSRLALSTLCQRIEAKGSAFQIPCLERDIFMAKRFGKCSKNALFMVKRHDGIGKIFMVASENYRMLPLKFIEDIYLSFDGEKGLGPMKCEGWEIDHHASRISFSFTNFEKCADVASIYGLSEKDTPVPCIEIISSDIGDYAFTVRGFWKVRHGCLYADEIVKKHSGEITVEEVVKETRETIFAKYTLFTERLIELLEINITPDSVLDAENHLLLLKKLVIRVLKEVSMPNFQYKKSWIERATEQLDPAARYTAYDIMSLILDTQEITKCKDTTEKVRKSMTRLPYLPYEKYRDEIIDSLGLFK